MAKVASVFAFMVLLAVVVEGRDWRFESAKRVKRGYNSGGFGTKSDGNYGRSDEHNTSVSRERLGCSEEHGGSYGSGSRELPYNRDSHSSDNNRRHRSFSKASASASAVAFNQNHDTNV